MRKFSLLGILVSFMLVASGCAAATPMPTPTVIPTVSPAPTALPSPNPTEAVITRLVNSCGLLNSQDLASFFTSHTEVIPPKPQIDQVNHPIFSAGNAAGTETSCVYYAFHLPGSSNEVVLQVNTWVDMPSSNVPPGAWTQDWIQASSSAAQAISGVGEEAFFSNGQLSFKTDTLYVTIAAVETDLDLKTPAGVDRQLAIEKQVALDMLGRLG